MILEKELKIKIGSKQVKYYTSLGYNVKKGEEIFIKNEDVLPGSRVLEKRKCDICGKEFTRKHSSHIKTFDRFNIDVCAFCVKNNENIKQIVKNKRANTLIEHYGINNPSKSEEIKNKKEKTLLENYGVTNPMKSDLIRSKAKQTNLEKYGYESAAKSDIVKEKSKKTCLKKYGVEYTSQVKESREKANQSYCKNGTQKVSKPQLEVYNLLKEKGYNVELNYTLSTLSLDVALFYNETKIDIEYDGSYWHQDKNKDRRRDEFVKSQGYKVFRILSDHKVPSIEELENNILNLINSDKNFSKIIL